MVKPLGFRITTDRVWFGLLVMYIITSYFAQDVFLPAIINTIFLYAFLGFSGLFILCSGVIRLSKILTWETLCMTLAFIAMLYSSSFSVLGGTYYAMIVNFVIVFILTQMEWNEKRFKLILKTYIFSAVGLVLALMVTGNLEDSSGRLGTELVGNANILACMLMSSTIYCIYILICSKEAFARVLYTLFLLIIYYGMFLSGGRKYVVIPIIFMYILLTNKTDKSGRKNIFKYTFFIILIFILLYNLIMKVPVLYEAIGHRFEGVFALFNDNYVVDSSTQKRNDMASAAIKEWMKSPIWGYGFDSFKYYNQANVTGRLYYSHNNFAELLYNQGIIGFFAYYGFYIYLFFNALKRKMNVLNKGFILGVIVALLVFEYYGITYSTTPIQILLFFCYYLMNADGNEEEIENNYLINNEKIIH